MKINKSPYLTKSRFVSAPLCDLWLWKGFYEKQPIEPSAVGSVPDIGDRVGRLAHNLFSNGVEVDEKPWEHKKACERTRDLMADSSVEAIYEAAFEYNNTRIRVDILERLASNSWGIREVKSTGSIRNDNKAALLKEKYYRDALLQLYVASGCGLDISSVEYVYINKEYDGPAPLLDATHFFIREEIIDEIIPGVESVSEEINTHLATLAKDTSPTTEPSKSKCNKLPGGLCPFWAECTKDKPEDWVSILYRIMEKHFIHLKNEGKHKLSDCTIEDGLNDVQKRMIQSAHNNADVISPNLIADLNSIALPAIHLDFEYLAGVALPLFPNTKPFEKIPFQYSAHKINADGSFEHIDEFLAKADEDPRKEFAEKLVELLGGGNEPIIVWNAAGAELPVLRASAEQFPDLSSSLNEIIDRVHDLAITVRENVMWRKLISRKALAGGGLFSLKNVAPACSASFSYDDLDGVANGGQALEAFFQLVVKELPKGVDEKALRKSMLAYCEKDTEATALVHQKLLEIVRK